MEIIKGIHRVDGVNANCYIIGDDELTVIDAGLPNNAGAILAYVKRMGRKPTDVKRIIITHGHIDHIGSLDALKKATGAQVAAHRDDADFIAGRKSMPRPKGSASLIFRILMALVKARHVQVDVLLEDGQEIAGLLVLHTPGHTPGSIALLDKKNGAIFVGDTLRVGKNGAVEASSERFTWNQELAEKSMKRIASFDFDVLLSGHGEPLKPLAAEKVREFLELRGHSGK